MTWFVQDAFLAWEESSDPEEQEGKGVALKSCTQFIQWLKEAEVEEDEEEKQNKEKVNITNNSFLVSAISAFQPSKDYVSIGHQKFDLTKFFSAKCFLCK